MFVLFLLLQLWLFDAKMIKNINIPSCRNCIYYKVEFYNDFSSNFNKCSFFGTKNIQTNVIQNDFAAFCRNDETACGLQGKYFKENPNVEFKIFLHNFIKNSPFNLLSFLVVITLQNNHLNK